MQSYSVTANSPADAASRVNNTRAQVWAFGGDVSFDPNSGTIYMTLPSGHLPSDLYPDLNYTTITTPSNEVSAASDPAPEVDTMAEGNPNIDPNIY